MKHLRQILENKGDDVDFHDHELMHHRSAKYTDNDGYTSEVVPAKPYAKLANEDGRHAGRRSGVMFIHHPNGEKVRAGYWMDYPEPGWKHNNVNLLQDYQKHAIKNEHDKSYWRKYIPLEHRVALEAHHQATAYDSLKNQFAYRKKILDRKND